MVSSTWFRRFGTPSSVTDGASVVNPVVVPPVNSTANPNTSPLITSIKESWADANFPGVGAYTTSYPADDGYWTRNRLVTDTPVAGSVTQSYFVKGYNLIVGYPKVGTGTWNPAGVTVYSKNDLVPAPSGVYYTLPDSVGYSWFTGW